MSHKHWRVGVRGSSRGAPGCTTAGVEDRTEAFYPWSPSVPFRLCVTVPASMMAKNSPADPCFELVPIEGAGDEAKQKDARTHLARSDTTPGPMQMTRCFRARESSGFLLTVPVS